MIENIGYTPTRKRANKIQNNIENIITESKETAIYERENLFLENSTNRDLSFGKSRSINEAGKSIKVNLESEKNCKLESFMISEAFANLVYDSIPLDENFKENNKNNIIEKTCGVFRKLHENGSIDEGNYAWRNYFNIISESTPLLKENANDLIKVEQILKETEENVKHNGKTISKVLEGKILETIKNEKLIANNKVELLQTNKKFTGNTLFSALLIKNVKDINVGEKYINAPQDKTMDIAFAESIIDYAILEGLNTLELVKFDVDVITHAIKHI